MGDAYHVTKYFDLYLILPHKKFLILNFAETLLVFAGICLFVIKKWAPLFDELLCYLGIEFKLTSQLIGLLSVGITTIKT